VSKAEYHIYSHGEIMEFRKAVAAMPELRQGPKALFNAIASAILIAKGNAIRTDDQLAVDIGCKDRTTVYRHRKRLLEARVIGFTPGRFQQSSIYWIAMTPMRRDEIISAKIDKATAARSRAKASSDARYVAIRRKDRPKVQHCGEQALQRSEKSLCQESATQWKAKNCNTATLQDCSTSSLQELPTSRLSDRRVSSYTREVINHEQTAIKLTGDHHAAIIQMLGDGDMDLGNEIAARRGDEVVAKLADLVKVVGIREARPDIVAARISAAQIASARKAMGERFGRPPVVNDRDVALAIADLESHIREHGIPVGVSLADVRATVGSEFIDMVVELAEFPGANIEHHRRLNAV
jgi:hypothetical protein